MERDRQKHDKKISPDALRDIKKRVADMQKRARNMGESVDRIQRAIKNNSENKED